jgi:hypothetical protein
MDICGKSVPLHHRFNVMLNLLPCIAMLKP